MNPWLITTDAVLCPTPGKASKASKLSGTLPSYLSHKILLSSAIALDFLGDKPQGLMIFLITSGSTKDISKGLSAKENSSGVTLFTLISVHCADNKTAINNV